MSQLGEPDELYVRARCALLDAADALGEQLDAVVLVGAQALYLHTGAADLAVAEYTTDADLAIHPLRLADSPLITALLETAGFFKDRQPGQWLSRGGSRVDLMVPEQLAGPGTRGADLGSHGRHVARRAVGLEAALIDQARQTITALDPADGRSAAMRVAGPGALLVAKVHKIADRAATSDRLNDKDALDLFRLLQCTPVDDLRGQIERLQADELSSVVTDAAVAHLRSLFGTAEDLGVRMAVRAVGALEDPAFIASSAVVLANDLLSKLRT